MRTKINCDAVKLLSFEINNINNSIIKETNDSVTVLNEIKNVWSDYNSEKIINEMITVVSTLNNVSKDLETLCNFCNKSINSYSSLDTNFKNNLVKDDKNE